MDDAKLKIAIIMPVYKGEKTLAAAIDSVLSQSLREIELWVVDDGSPDGSGAIMDEYGVRDNRVKVLHKQNGGCYHARLSALERINAPYFTFVDQDDIVEPNLCEELYNFAEENRLDVAMCDSTGASAVGMEDELYLSRSEVVDGYLYDTLITGGDQVTMWGKLYRNQYDFSRFGDVGNVTAFEDMIFNLQLFEKVSRFGIRHRGLYGYIVNAGSWVRNFSIRGLADMAEGLRMRRKWLPKYGVSGTNAELLNARWLVKNASNALISAATAPLDGAMSRRDAICAAVGIDGVDEAVKMLKVRCDTSMRRYIALIECGRCMPAFLFSIVLRIALYIKKQSKIRLRPLHMSL